MNESDSIPQNPLDHFGSWVTDTSGLYWFHASSITNLKFEEFMLDANTLYLYVFYKVDEKTKVTLKIIEFSENNLALPTLIANVLRQLDSLSNR